MNKIALFLDFDGVLHPQPSPFNLRFQGVPQLAEALRQYPDKIDLVISSSWRESDSLEDLKAHFPEDLRAWIVGITPIFSSMTQNEIDAMLPISWENLDREGKRQREIELWLRTNRPDGVPWIAIDDMASDFAPGCPDLLLTHGRVGIQPSDIRTLHAMVRLRLAEL